MSLGTVNKGFDGQTDSSGNLTIAKINPSPAKWAALKVVGQTQGAATRWAILVSGTARAFSPGDRIDDVIYVQPGELVDVQVTGAVPGVDLNGTMAGISGDSLEEIAPFIMLVPDVVGVQNSSPQVGPIRLDAAAGTRVSINLLPPAGTQAIAWVEDQNAPGNPTAFSLVGNSTLVTYFDKDSAAPGFSDGAVGSPYVVMAPQADEPLGFTFTLDATGSAGACRVFLYYYTSQAVVNIRQNPTDVFSMTLQGTFPADWQAPNAGFANGSPFPNAINAAIASGATATILFGAGAPDVTRLFSMGYTIDEPAAAGRFVAWKMSVEGVIWWQDSFVSSTGWRKWDNQGGQVGQVTTDNIIATNNGSVGITLRGVMGYSQGPNP